MLAAPWTYAMKCCSRTLQLPHGVCWMSRLLNIDGSAHPKKSNSETVSAKLTKQNKRQPSGSKDMHEPAVSERSNLVSECRGEAAKARVSSAQKATRFAAPHWLNRAG